MQIKLNLHPYIGKNKCNAILQYLSIAFHPIM